MRRWLTPDPLDFHESYNLYRYVKNNPHRYLDKDGRFAFVIPLALFSFDLGVSITAIALPTLYTAMAATAATATYCGIKAIDQKYGTNIAGSLFQHGNCVLNSETLQETAEPTKESHSDIKEKYLINVTGVKGQKNVDVYIPDKEFPDGERVAESADPHTQLGSKQGRNGKYPQAREWGKNGEAIRDIDFTDHGRPEAHLCPHQHEWKPNPTGGTKQRERVAKPVTNWNYHNEN